MNSPYPTSNKTGKPLWFFVCIAILGAGIASYILLLAFKPAPEQRDPAELIPLVEVSPLQYRESSLLIEGNGIVMPKAAIAISTQVSGEIVSLHPNMVSGGAFEKGDLIVQIDPRTYQANLNEATATQAANQANLDFLNRQVERLRSLRENDFAGEEALEDAINRREQTLASIARQQAIIENRALDLERASIRAPFTGRIFDESVDLGDIVAPGRELARFYASDEVEIVVSLNADDSVFIPGLWSQVQGDSTGRQAWITVDHGNNTYQWRGYVHRVESDIDRTTRTVDVVVRIPSPFTPGEPVVESGLPVSLEAPPLLVGMYADVAIDGMTIPGHFVLPVSAVHQDNTLWTVAGENRLQQVSVDFIRQEGNLAVLLAADLPEGTPIIISDIALVTDGMRIQVNPVSPGAIH
ncbi:MAG: efflux RND transporter periplasmic adaptor subunit [Gammaproteobacteria bacterium]|nr:efflux RND transporter periplasmic adaptor subunit [Gammaproteobacteria bacterium]